MSKEIEKKLPVGQPRLVRLLHWAECKLAGKRAAINAQLAAACPVAREEWEAGTLRGSPARRRRKTGECQFVLWKAGEQGHAEDQWIRFDSSWWSQFLPNVKEHATPLAGAGVETGVEVHITGDVADSAASGGCCVSSCSPLDFSRVDSF